MEIESKKNEKKSISFFCCFSTNCGKSRKKKSNKKNTNTKSTTAVNSNNSIENKFKPSVKEFVLSNEKENSDKNKNESKDIDNPSKKVKINNINTLVNINNKRINFSLLSEKSINTKNKSINENNMNKNKKLIENFEIVKKNSENDLLQINKSNKAYKSNNNNFSNSENSIKNIIEGKSGHINCEEYIKYEINNSDDINDNVNIYDNNTRSFNKKSEKKNQKLNLKDSYILKYNFKNNIYPTDLNLTSISKKNNPIINSFINIEPKLNLSSFKNSLNFNLDSQNIHNKDETIIIQSNEIKNIDITQISPKETKYKLHYSKSLNFCENKKIKKINKIVNQYINRSGIFFILKNNNSFDSPKIKFGFKYENIPKNIKKIKINNNLSKPINKVGLNNIKQNKSQNNDYSLNNNNILDIDAIEDDKEKSNTKYHITSKSQNEIEQIEHKLNYINYNYFEDKNDKNKNEVDKNNENNNGIINTKKENIEINLDTKEKNNENIKEDLEKKISDLEGDIEDPDMDEEESKKINDTKSIMSNYINNPFLVPHIDARSGIQSLFSRGDFNFHDFKENISNFNEIMSNKESAFPHNNYNETEIEIMNENGKEFSSFIETPRASGVYNKKYRYKNSNLNFNMNNTYNFKNMNIKMKNIRDKINQNAKEIQNTNEKINKLDEKIKEYEKLDKQYEIWIEQEEEENEFLVNMLNYLNNNRK